MFTLDELVEQFDITKCSKAGARFDYQKGIITKSSVPKKIK